ncbi:MAG: hypothetical protein GTN84_00305 [Hydrogenophaga sp.]|uniref:type III secretion apparatus assembly protein SctX n=1 Tax=Hydrogenophaga sp. TaxID=1904254 RepID=UPI0016BA2056|nr:hypothetical protein [Hydrogenophaga sp.]NIM39593.1 hypothetical protein [Hydrogenophaga sp.]NIN24797.1 hypothetical protein [Hydrogenophaga sp.]NIN29309.1 hypothetical protein [Hydrogenophaga sp.]NIN53832.1 hypothetical protein [Hydrogenophaga sp.]NIO50036.1 hypothetical protein [Hydrogenophaga sp.]
MAIDRDRRVRRAPPPPPLRIDQGIEKILRGPVKRPDDRQAITNNYSPAYTATRQRLDELYAMPNLDDYLVAEMSPLVSEGSLLLPHRFVRELGEAREVLRQARDRQKRHARVFSRAIDVLSDQMDLRDLLQSYLTALYKG